MLLPDASEGVETPALLFTPREESSRKLLLGRATRKEDTTIEDLLIELV